MGVDEAEAERRCCSVLPAFALDKAQWLGGTKKSGIMRPAPGSSSPLKEVPIAKVSGCE